MQMYAKISPYRHNFLQLAQQPPGLTINFDLFTILFGEFQLFWWNSAAPTLNRYKKIKKYI